ncbi:MAG: DUF1893 domain-containing protein [Ruminococcaceae bacterium]|nr:DUF1893 domain-containing protein [Oscillospiraceae bacterium]
MHCVNLEKAKMLLQRTDSTCVLCGGNTILTDKRRGVRPLLDLLESGTAVAGFSAADKVVGKAAAFLYCLLGINCLYAPVISQPALAVLQNAGIDAEYDQLVPAIRNRAGDGFCPMESAVWEISDPHEALKAIQDTLKKL